MHITANIAGRTIDSALTDGKELILRFTDGHEAVITWDKGADEPRLKAINVRIVLPVPPMALGGVYGCGS